MANTLRGLDQEELDFLSQVNEKKKIQDQEKKKELQKGLLEFKAAREKVVVKQIDIQPRVKVAPVLKKELKQVLVKRKSSQEEVKSSKKIVEYSDSD